MSLKAELRQVLYDLALTREPGRDEVAHFCQHAGIRIWFVRARTTWHALGPSGVKPWWLILEPLRKRPATKDSRNKNKNDTTEVIDNA